MVAVLTIAIVLTGCGENAVASGVVVDTLANGAIQVTSPEVGIWAPDEAWSLEPELTIGSLMSDGPDSFARIALLAVDGSGRIYVGDGTALELRVFAPDGSHLRTVGRDGSGPGEFRQMQATGWGPDGNLWVVDGQNGFVVYDTAGAFVQTRPRPGAFQIFPWPGRFDNNGGITDVGPMDDTGRFPLIRYTNDFQQADTMRLPEVEMESYVQNFPGGGRVSYSVPFTSSLSYHVDHAGYLWTGNTAEYRLVRQSPEGDTVMIVQRSYTPEPVTAAEKEQALENLHSFVEQGGEVDPSRIPAHKPAYGRISSDDSGFLWVTPTLPDSLRDTFAADIFDPAGRFLGRVSSRDRISLSPAPVIQGNRMTAVVRDSLDVPVVRRYRIQGRN